mgnify:CR=1 FL=1
MELSAFKLKGLYDGKGNFIEKPVLILKDGIFNEILDSSLYGKLETLNISDIVDFSDKYAMPGLIDCHTHLMLPGNGDTAEKILETKSIGEIALIAGYNASTALKNGVTTIRDCGCALGISFDIKNFIQSGYINGPDIILCGMPITSSCGHLNRMGGIADGGAEITKLIRKQRMNGIDFVKLIASSGASKGVKPGITFTQDELDTAVSEAHRLNMKVSVHATSVEAVKMAVSAGAERIEHGWWINTDGTEIIKDTELAEYIIQHDIMTCPTLPVMESSINYYAKQLEAGYSEDIKKSYDSLKSYNDTMLKAFCYQYSCGIAFAGGSDSGWRHMGFADGMKNSVCNMYKCGVTLKDIIKISTYNSAKYIGLEKTHGSIEYGKTADFLVMNSDPGKDIAAYSSIFQVYKRGKPVL